MLNKARIKTVLLSLHAKLFCVAGILASVRAPKGNVFLRVRKGLPAKTQLVAAE